MADDAPSLQQPLTGNSATPRKKRPWSIVDFLVQFRWILVIFVVLPVSFAFQCNKDFWDWWSNRKSFAQREREHQAAVQKLVNRLKSRDRRRDGLVCTSRKPWLSVSMRNSDYKRARRFEVDMNEFCQILAVDTVNRIARCEPYVSMGQLSAVTVPLGYALEVVPELDDLTVGGLINGYGIEGSSHIYGLFQVPPLSVLPGPAASADVLVIRFAPYGIDKRRAAGTSSPHPPPPSFPPPFPAPPPPDTVEAYEIVLADGTLVRATRDNEHADLFYAIPWSQGTLGLLVAAEIRLIPVKEFMRVTYTPVRGTLREMTQAYIDSFCPRDGDQDNPDKVPDFVEGMVYTRSEGVMMTGRYASREEATRPGNVINNCGWWWTRWFYQHATDAFTRGEFVEYIPTRQYYHRHTRSLYWEGKLILPFGDQWWFRVLLGWMMPPKVSFLKLTQGEAIRNYYHERHVCQDMLVPLYKVADALELNEREFEVYPIWLCPHRLFMHPMRQMINPEPGFWDHRQQGDTAAAQMFTDIGLYYAPGAVMRGEEFDGVAAVQRMEKWLIENASFQALYAVTELNERDFWRMFDVSLYAACREKYQAVGTFMSVYYKSKKGRKTEAEVMQEERKEKEVAIAESA
ncbi:unnamed protein product [Closterium sp. Naga37s-1]|nr:unnamed protein product [Closterium sp. Naga37s-1]